MLKKSITYEDFNGDTVTEDFFFHLSKAELVELELSHKDGLSKSLERIIAAEDNRALISEFKSIIMSSYGKRSEDGKRFIKNQEIRDEFESSEAYSVLFMELVTDTNAAIEFVQGMIPPGLEEEAEKIKERQQANLKAVKENAEVIDRSDVAKMTPEELRDLGTRLQAGEAVLGE